VVVLVVLVLVLLPLFRGAPSPVLLCYQNIRN
jgi:hypothetical protein